jgi:organic hydroperoxide reductase OsmC/OhrA
MWTFKTSLNWKGGETADLLCANKPTLDIVPPPDFGGKDNQWSPEDLLVGAVESCLLLTVLYFVDKYKISMEAYSSEAAAHMERTPNGLRFNGIELDLNVKIGSAEDRKKMEKAVEQGEKYCPVAAAVNCPITTRLTLETP